MSRPRSHRLSHLPTDGERFHEELLVDLSTCVETDMGGSWLLISTVITRRLRHVPRGRRVELSTH